ncbi:hypothetical protein [Nitrobacter sp. JJSN]|uniref:hypothetical protein n=1 Tax=Nitrobacter sp. JJSN TaxID=3453033 RepID=UPI003F75F2E4
MDIEQIFAAEVFNAPRTAANACKAGMPQTVPDIIGMALTDIWAFYSAGHFSREHISAIVDKYVAYDANDEPWPRDDLAWGNVVPLR